MLPTESSSDRVCDDDVPFVLDLDGVVWLGEQIIPGAVEAVKRLQASKHEVLFVTNMSMRTKAGSEAALARHGIDAEDSVITSAMAAATLVEPGERVYVVGGPGVVEACTGRGAEIVTGDAADVVVVGMDFSFSYDDLSAAMRVVRNGARLVGTNHDPSYPTPDGLQAGGGSLVTAIAYAAEVTPIFAGKPHRPAADLVRSRLGSTGIMVGDRPDSDGLFAQALGYEFALVLTGVVTADDLPVSPEPTYIAESLATLVNHLL